MSKALPPLDPAVDYVAEYDNRGRVPDHPAHFAAWAQDSADWRAERPPLDLPYGAGDRERIDLFEAGDGPAVLYIHGGYWQSMDRSSSSVCARGLNLAGVTVGVAGYDLCPAISIAGIVAQMRQAARTLARHTARPVVVAGHSAGGHLAACLLALEPEVRAAYAISGLFDLRPLIGTPLNRALALDEEEAVRQSPLFWVPPTGKVLDAVLGSDESGEYHRQSRAIIETWGEAGVQARYDAVEGANHFTVLAPLAREDSAMVQRIADLTRR
ncbi:MAG: alpha/beta hydrolase [Caulobacteraceae bacterium]|nr:alpha/beta hydrolase [Caulobacteraceae bacterium]